MVAHVLRPDILARVIRTRSHGELVTGGVPPQLTISAKRIVAVGRSLVPGLSPHM